VSTMMIKAPIFFSSMPKFFYNKLYKESKSLLLKEKGNEFAIIIKQI
jgi:hypothetical protein